jgi:hypothetical protein
MLGVVRKGAATFSLAGMIALPLSQNRLASESGRFVTHEVLVISPKEEALQALSIPKNIAWNLLTLRLSPRGELSRFDSKTKQFQPFLGGISAQGVSYSKDGKSIAYVSYPEGILWKATRYGSSPVQLTDPPLQAFMPRWSPDGKKISFAGKYPGPNSTSSPQMAAARRSFSPRTNIWMGFLPGCAFR